ncbi:MAG: hypothetical protein ACYDCF_07080 [Burkholderiales bacterium]|nr:hypothetical protein [Ferrovum sp.]
MTEIIEGWQCIGCGKIDVDRPCVGICQDQKVKLVLAADFNRLLSRNKKLESIVRRLMLSKPRPDAWEKSFKALQAESTRVLSDQSASPG